MRKTIKVALAGQPNVGKSMLINAISNAKLKVGNFSGVTVEKSVVSFAYKEYDIQIIDLPGTYSLEGFTIEEKVAKEFLLHEEYDIIINVADSTKLKRNFLLTFELANLNRKMILVCNMIDEAKKENINIDTSQIASILSIPVVATSAATKEGVDTLLDSIIKLHQKPRKPIKLLFNDAIEQEIVKLRMFLQEKNFFIECNRDKGLVCCKNSKKECHQTTLTPREIAIKLIQEDKRIFRFVHDQPIFTELQPLLIEAHNNIYTYYQSKNVKEIFEEEAWAMARGLYQETVSQEQNDQSATELIDNVLINKIFGIPIFLFFMWGLFQLTFEIGSIPMEWIEKAFGLIGDIIGSNIPHEGARALIVDGIIAGVGAVVLFLPNIMILFLGIALLETTGYMSRVAFLLDGFFHKFGLHGKSFIPLVTGFGCSVPAYMAARTLKSEKDRLITLFIIGFMSCGARLPVYVLFVGVFFEAQNAGNILFLIYISGALLGLVFAKLLRSFVFKSADEPFVMEMPKYRLPSLRVVWFQVYRESLMYLKKAGTFILAASMMIWFASNYPKVDIPTQLDPKDAQAYSLENSYLGQIGKATEWIFEPVGFDWKMTVALETGLAAKEVIVATLGILYSVGDEVDETSESLKSQLKKHIPFASAVSFIVFVMIYLPCFAASLVFAKEAGGYRYLAYLFVFTTVVAWALSFVAYNVTSSFV
jgi:ferrous iron transport protein B